MRENNTMTESNEALASAAVDIAFAGAKAYLQAKNLKVHTPTLSVCLRSWVKTKFPEAIRDAQEAIACGMNDIAATTFKASMVQAGIEAAKECGYPENLL